MKGQSGIEFEAAGNKTGSGVKKPKNTANLSQNQTSKRNVPAGAINGAGQGAGQGSK